MSRKTGFLLISIVYLALSASWSVKAAPETATAADLKPVHSHILILTRKHLCLTVDKTEERKSAKVEFLPCHGRANQRWTLSKGGYLIHYGKRLRQCLSVPENLLRRGTALRLWDCKNIAGQRWYHNENRLFLFLPKRGLCVTYQPRRSKHKDPSAVLGSCMAKNGTTLSLAKKLPLPLKPVQLKLKTHALCIDKTSGLKNGVEIQMTQCRPKDSRQYFKLEKQRGDEIQIQSVQSGKCLSVANASKKAGAPVQQWSCLGHEHQLWKKIDYRHGWFALQARHSGLCLTTKHQKGKKHASLRQYRCQGAHAAQQLFKMIQ